MPGLDAPTEYIQLAFLIDRHFPGYVDAYYGPPELKAGVTAGNAPPLEALADRAAALGESISTDASLTPDRRTFLEEECRAMRRILGILRGDIPDIAEEVETLYGVRPVWIDENVFREAHLTLARLLPGSDPLPERVQAFRERSRLPFERALSIIDHLLEDFRGRTLELFGLPPGESCETAVVADQSWRAYNWYLGDGKSRIEFNQDFPLEIWDIPTTVAHEAYPGHHTERAIKENRLYHDGGRLEHAIALSNTPSALISEGIATNGLRAVVSPSDLAAILKDCYQRAGLPESDAARAADFIEASRALESVVDNQVLLLYREHAPAAEVADYGIRHALTTEADEVRLLRFLQDPLSRSYAYNYTLGRELIAAFLDQAPDRQQAFGRLLSEPLTPAQIRAALSKPR